MKIQINSDKNVDSTGDFNERTEADLAHDLTRFENRLTRVEVHLSNESAGRSTGEDFRCLIEARPAGMDPVAVTNNAETLDDAIRGASDKLRSLLTSTFERLDG